MDLAGELDELRRRAYSRSGTDDDRRRLAELETSARVVAPSAVLPTEPVEAHLESESADPSETDPSVTDPSATGDPRLRRSRWLAAGLGAAVGALLATATTLAFVPVSTPQSEPEAPVASALAVFDREPSQADFPSDLSFSLDGLIVSEDGTTLVDPDDVTLRFVGMATGNDVYAARVREGDETTICLIVVSSEGAGTACTSEATFVIHGVGVEALGIEVKWGPTGTKVWVHSFG
jgi:hypothetical protein